MALRAFLLVVYLFTPAEGLDELLGRDLVTTAPSAPDAIPTDFAFANIRRHHDVMLKRVEGVPSHLVLDDESALGGARVLYVADTGNGRVLAVDPDGSRFERQARKDD